MQVARETEKMKSCDLEHTEGTWRKECSCKAEKSGKERVVGTEGRRKGEVRRREGEQGRRKANEPGTGGKHRCPMGRTARADLF